MTDSFELPESLSRRGFLKLSASSLLALGLPVRWPRLDIATEIMGRVVDPTVDIYSRPSFGSELLETIWRDELFDIVAAWVGDKVPEHNRIWYEVDGRGYAHSSSVQPVKDIPNTPLEFVPQSGLLSEVTVPFVDAYWRPRSDSEHVYRFYYGSTYWITGVSRDVSLNKWYRILDDKYAYVYYAPAEAFRPIPEEEILPLSPDVPHWEKRIEVDLQRQWVHCYEGSRLVFSTKVSTGRKFGQEFYWTPAGEFETFRKRPSRHMAAGNLASGYDVPGVSWVSYINEEGVAFHGTYWHNDFGMPRSHGCINMTHEAAKWLYRWTNPVVPHSELQVWENYGTSVNIRV